MCEIALPPEIAGLVGGRGVPETVGMSGDAVIMYPEAVLKISGDSAGARREAEALELLSGRLPVPQVIRCLREGGRQYLLMTRLRGTMLCREPVISDPRRVAELMAEALEMMWALGECPIDSTLDVKLRMAGENVALGLVDTDNVEPGTFGPKGFRDPEALLRWLEDNRPEEELRFTHGDFCLPNILTDGRHVTGLCDLGKAGMADPWCDLAIGYRSLRDNTNGSYGGPVTGFDPETLFRALGIAPDREKLRYYLLLDELF